MTSFFDEATHAITVLAHYDPRMPDVDFVQRVQAIEAPVIAKVLANACHPDFPDDLRRKICRVIAKNDYAHPTLVDGHNSRAMLLGTHHSDLIADLHSLFHDLARRRAPLGTTTWSDSPTQNLVTIADSRPRLDIIRALAMSVHAVLAPGTPPTPLGVQSMHDAATGILRELDDTSRDAHFYDEPH